MCLCTQGDGEKSPCQWRPSSPSSNSPLGGYGRYTPSRSPQNYSRAGPEVHMGGKYSSLARDSSSLSSPIPHLGGVQNPSMLTRDTSSLPAYYSGTADRSGGAVDIGKYSPSQPSGSGNLSLQLNPTTLAMLQQHNYIPYFKGIKACLRQTQKLDELVGLLLLSALRKENKHAKTCNLNYLHFQCSRTLIF
ncbi:hypothetical protein ILYODFUR_034396 [Ilyodon furcidens]|uniref:Uncharacterized protein n=1 Tax=Ilyodon furcidens TaxID=33524 RepID=A0ABV0UXK0_9TELE